MSNVVEIVGVIAKEVVLNNEVGSCKFYRTEIAVRRESGIEDLLPVIVSDCLVREIVVGETAYIKGSFRSFNDKTSNAVNLFVYAEEIVPVDTAHVNTILLDGFVCKTPIIRMTPKGRTICDLVIASNRACGQSDYIPCVFWERNAKLASELKVGQEIHLAGRIQSRSYKKKIGDETKIKVAYEVSVSHLAI